MQHYIKEGKKRNKAPLNEVFFNKGYNDFKHPLMKHWDHFQDGAMQRILKVAPPEKWMDRAGVYNIRSDILNAVGLDDGGLGGPKPPPAALTHIPAQPQPDLINTPTPGPLNLHSPILPTPAPGHLSDSVLSRLFHERERLLQIKSDLEYLNDSNTTPILPEPVGASGDEALTTDQYLSAAELGYVPIVPAHLQNLYATRLRIPVPAFAKYQPQRLDLGDMPARSIPQVLPSLLDELEDEAIVLDTPILEPHQLSEFQPRHDPMEEKTKKRLEEIRKKQIEEYQERKRLRDERREAELRGGNNVSDRIESSIERFENDFRKGRSRKKIQSARERDQAAKVLAIERSIRHINGKIESTKRQIIRMTQGPFEDEYEKEHIKDSGLYKLVKKDLKKLKVKKAKRKAYLQKHRNYLAVLKRRK